MLTVINMMRKELKNWVLIGGETEIPACVPGDITADFYAAGRTPDPFFGLNHKNLSQTIGQDYSYRTVFDFGEKIKEGEELVLRFGGVDLFADIYLNGTLLGKTENMFLEYEYLVTDIVKGKGNVLEVHMHSTTARMEQLDCKDYFGVFNVPRLLLRKEQCCFGWDWAPNVPSYGLWKPVTLETRSKDRIVDVHYTADCNGEAIIHVELNYFKRSGYDKFGNFGEADCRFDEDELRISLAKTPFGNDYEVITFPVTGNKSFAAFQNEEAKLWWPHGYGEQPLYPYLVELVRAGKVISSVKGRLAFRTVELKQKRLAPQMLGYQFLINGEEIFIKGSNWVPVDCFTGCIRDEKYKKLILLAKSGNFNMLRVWGGGIYENDIFYDLCDEEGMLVWQDFMFACADIPDDDEHWLKNAEQECIYQVKRLRNHPALIYWCGGNEKTGSFGSMVTYGDYFVDTILRGIVKNYDTTRPFGRQSPCSMTDVGNDTNSGETHHNCSEPCIAKGMASYRDLVAEKVVPFVSECAIMGPNSRQTFEKIFPQEKLWPMNEYWEDRLMDNPYAAVKLGFAERQLRFAEELYGKAKNLDDFIKKGMSVHAESLKCEMEYQRAHKGVTSGFLNWMYSEIWPTGTWSVIDYYTEPKQAFYQMAKSFRPVLVSFYRNKAGKTVLFGVNDTLQERKVVCRYGMRDLNGRTLWEERTELKIGTKTPVTVEVKRETERAGTYLFVEYSENGKQEETLYSYDFWSSCRFESDYTVEKRVIDVYTAEIIIRAHKFAKSVFITTPNNCEIVYSDNWFDVQAGGEKTIVMHSEKETDWSEVTVTDFALEGEKHV